MFVLVSSGQKIVYRRKWAKGDMEVHYHQGGMH